MTRERSRKAVKKEITNDMVPIDDLVPYAKNARKHPEKQIEALCKSIAAFGFVNPVSVWKGNELIAGHGRVIAAKRLLETGKAEYAYLAEIPVRRCDHLSDKDRRALALADNQIALQAEWDEDLLQEELSALFDGGVDLDVTGFEAEEVNAYLRNIQGDDIDNQEDEVPSLPITPETKQGDVWVLGKHRLMCGDSTNVDEVKKLVGTNLIDCMWTDPPYNVAYEGTAGTIKNDSMSSSSFRIFLNKAFSAAFAVMRKGAPAYIAHADTEGYNFRGAFTDAGFKLSSCIIWKKNSLVLGRSDYQWQHEPILYGWKEGARHKWFGARNKTTVVSSDCAEFFSQVDENTWQLSVGDRVFMVSAKELQVQELPTSVVLENKPSRNAEHPTMKPVALVERFILNSTKKEEIVLDLFGGSGSTLIACEKLGRKAYLMELDEKFCDVIVKRWEDYTGKKARRLKK